MNKIAHSPRGGHETAANGDLRALLALLDEPSEKATFDDGVLRLVTSVALLRREVVAPS